MSDTPPLTHEQVLRQALEAGQDPHRAWAAVRFNKPAAEVTNEERNTAKTESFHLLYSQSFLGTVNWPKNITLNL